MGRGGGRGGGRERESGREGRTMYNVCAIDRKSRHSPATQCIPVSVSLVLLRVSVVRVVMETMLATPTSDT